MYRALNKLLRSRIKFYLRFVKYFLIYSYLRNNLFLDRPPIELDACAKRTRTLLKLKPTWGRGHLLLGILSYYSFLESKDPYFLGVIDISAQALEDIHYDKSIVGLLRLCLDFLNKQYSKINSGPLDDELSKPDGWAVRYLDILRLELIGSSFMAEDKRVEAKSIFKKIHPERRSQEVRVAFMMFEALNPGS